MTPEQTRTGWMQRRAEQISRLIDQAKAANVRLQSLDDKSLFISVERAALLTPSYLAGIVYLNGWRVERGTARHDKTIT
jgi:hypothetical protein